MKKWATACCMGAVFWWCAAVRADDAANAEQIRKLTQTVEEQGKIIQDLSRERFSDLVPFAGVAG